MASASQSASTYEYAIREFEALSPPTYSFPSSIISPVHSHVLEVSSKSFLLCQDDLPSLSADVGSSSRHILPTWSALSVSTVFSSSCFPPLSCLSSHRSSSFSVTDSSAASASCSVAVSSSCSVTASSSYSAAVSSCYVAASSSYSATAGAASSCSTAAGHFFLLFCCCTASSAASSSAAAVTVPFHRHNHRRHRHHYFSHPHSSDEDTDTSSNL